MAKYEEVFEDTKELFEGLVTSYNLDNYINIKYLSSTKLKEVGQAVKASDLVKYETKNDVYIVINEKVFDQLDEEQRLIMAEHIIAGISFNTEKDKLEMRKPDILAHSGVLKKYGVDKFLQVNEIVKLMFQQEKDVEEDAQ
jgi:hypothetical protein